MLGDGSEVLLGGARSVFPIATQFAYTSSNVIINVKVALPRLMLVRRHISVIKYIYRNFPAARPTDSRSFPIPINQQAIQI